jgi:hypothetical protein
VRWRTDCPLRARRESPDAGAKWNKGQQIGSRSGIGTRHFMMRGASMKRERVVRKGWEIVRCPAPTSAKQTSDCRDTRLLRGVTDCQVQVCHFAW